MFGYDSSTMSNQYYNHGHEMNNRHDYHESRPHFEYSIGRGNDQGIQQSNRFLNNRVDNQNHDNNLGNTDNVRDRNTDEERRWPWCSMM